MASRKSKNKSNQELQASEENKKIQEDSACAKSKEIKTSKQESERPTTSLRSSSPTVSNADIERLVSSSQKSEDSYYEYQEQTNISTMIFKLNETLNVLNPSIEQLITLVAHINLRDELYEKSFEKKIIQRRRNRLRATGVALCLYCGKKGHAQAECRKRLYDITRIQRSQISPESAH